jgi:putative PIN family toxin of toxin-antitoxin system
LKIVLDTNVLVSALLRSPSLPAQVLDLVLARQTKLALDERIFAEYCVVLSRPEFAFPSIAVRELVDFLWRASERISAPRVSLRLPDPSDAMFIEVAAYSLADALVTGNRRHFPAEQRLGVRVLTPREFLELWAARR